MIWVIGISAIAILLALFWVRNDILDRIDKAERFRR